MSKSGGSNTMRCSNSLSLPVKRAFICCRCSQERVVLCEDCATFCHLLHWVEEIELEEDLSLMCDCGNARSINERCLLDSNKPDFNLENIYLFDYDTPKFDLQYNARRIELLSKSGNYYIDRAIHLAASKCYLASMEDVSTAIAWDCGNVESRMLKIDVAPFAERIHEMANDFLLSIKNIDRKNIMPSIEVFRRFWKRVQSTFKLAMQKKENIKCFDNLFLLSECVSTAGQRIMDEFWIKAASFDVISICSKVQFDLYKTYVLPGRTRRPSLITDLDFFDVDNSLSKEIARMRWF